MKSKSGYTLIELMVVVLLFSLMLMGVYGVLLTGDIVYKRSATLLDMESQCRNAVDRLVREARQISSQTITVDYFGTSNDSIIFTIPNASGVRYFVYNNRLYRRAPNGTFKVLASNISSFKLSTFGALMTVRITASQTLYNQPVTYSLNTKVRLRNE